MIAFTLSKLQEIINNQTVGILLHGKSLEQLDSHIHELKDSNICWIGINDFPMTEEILFKINEKFDIILDFASVPHARIEYYEKKQRIPRLKNYLDRLDDNIWVVTFGLIRDGIKPFYPDFLELYDKKILIIDYIFPLDEIPKWMDVPNTATLAIALAMAGKAKKIITFGLDGYDGSLDHGLKTYYNPEAVYQERLASMRYTHDAGINRDTKAFEIRFPEILQKYKKLFNNDCEVYNCSPNSLFQIPKKISYEQLKEVILNG